MANVNQILAFAVGAQARVLSPDAYAALAARVNGFVAGIADETELNTVWRQSSFVAAMIAQFTVDRAKVDVLDDGDINKLEINFAKAVIAAASSADSPIVTSGAIPAAQTKILNVVGSGVWTVPAGVYLLRRVRMWGGGGGGGGAANNSSAGAGGGPGAYWEGAIPVTPGQQIPYTIAAGGSAGVGGASPGAGGTGGTTTFGSYVTCPGATGGQAANGGVNVNPGLGTQATQAGTLNGFTAPVAGAGIGFPVGSGYGGGFGAPAYGVSNAGPNVQAGGINGIYPGSGGNGSSSAANGGAGAAGLIIIDY